MQQTNLLSIQQFDSASVMVEQTKVAENEPLAAEPLLPNCYEDDVLSDKQERATDDNYARDESAHVSTVRSVCKRSPGRPKKIGVTSQV